MNISLLSNPLEHCAQTNSLDIIKNDKKVYIQNAVNNQEKAKLYILALTSPVSAARYVIKKMKS
ncbi:hypothetical protein P4K82_25840 [Bacillus cereus]|nr:hypothetical protein [Bacillus cereus]